MAQMLDHRKSHCGEHHDAHDHQRHPRHHRTAARCGNRYRFHVRPPFNSSARADTFPCVARVAVVRSRGTAKRVTRMVRYVWRLAVTTDLQVTSAADVRKQNGPAVSNGESVRSIGWLSGFGSASYLPQGKVVATVKTTRASLEKNWAPSDALRSLPSIHLRARLNLPAV